MAVGQAKPLDFKPVAGIRLAAVAGGIRYGDRLDLVLIEIAEGSAVAGVFTRNVFRAAPVVLAEEHLGTHKPRYFLINTGNANAGTGAAGKAAALVCCQAVADIANISVQEVLPFSTGVIGEPLPIEKIQMGIPDAYSGLSDSNWPAAAKGIMTTDTRPKLVCRQLEIENTVITITGIAKGSGMIKPDMATMLSYVFTDARIDGKLLDNMLRQAVNRSFNRISVDGDTSTNDCCMLVATGKSGVSMQSGSGEVEIFNDALQELCEELATDLIKDAEGASKFVTVTVNGGHDEAECLRVAYCIAESPLVKTAFFASDPNWGRILAAIGRSGVEDLNLDTVSIALGDTLLLSNGGLDPGYTEARGQSEMDREELTVTVDLARGNHGETVWTSDLSHDYVRINADYRS